MVKVQQKISGSIDESHTLGGFSWVPCRWECPDLNLQGEQFTICHCAPAGEYPSSCLVNSKWPWCSAQCSTACNRASPSVIRFSSPIELYLTGPLTTFSPPPSNHISHTPCIH